ncbi:hypothetical protein LOZ36_006323 [Ophidiomyces ophidiicola]|nr:hypothetical protein LOZ36_006323 [Ophidiomyces ophidiicola]
MSRSSFELLPRHSIDDSSDELEDRVTLLPKPPDHIHPMTSNRLLRIRCLAKYYARQGHSVISFIEKPFKTTCNCQKRSFRCVFRVILLLVGTFILLSALEALLYPSYQTPPEHYQELRRKIDASKDSGRGNPNNEKIFIAANIINASLIRGPWGRSVLELIDILGEENVFISIYENDSGNGTRDALRHFQEKLPCNFSVATGGHIPLSELPAITTPSGENRTKRIAYLAEVRNRALRPLNLKYTPHPHEVGFHHATMKFDRILFLNDIYFSPTDAAQLLFSTNQNKYRAACAIDFTSNVMFYDSFVVRDTNGYGMGLMFFPWFPPTGSAQSRNAVLAESDAVPVRSCWGGMVSFDAVQFQNMSTKYSPSIKSRFRHEPEPFWEGAECCLIFADLEDAYGEPNGKQGSGVFVNPYIRVAYTWNTWHWLGFFQRFERIFRNLQWIVSKIGYPEYNPRRLDRPGQLVKQKVWKNHEIGHGGSFQTVERTASPGGFCGQRRMFLMKRDLELANTRGEKNWEKLAVPWW